MATYQTINEQQQLIENPYDHSDRIIILKPIPGKEMLDSTGNIDKRLFSGDNNLRAVFENGTLWRLKFDKGDVPGALKQQFTSFTMALKTAREYYAKRNISAEAK